MFQSLQMELTIIKIIVLFIFFCLNTLICENQNQTSFTGDTSKDNHSTGPVVRGASP